MDNGNVEKLSQLLVKLIQFLAKVIQLLGDLIPKVILINCNI